MYAPCCAVSMTLASQATDLRHSGPRSAKRSPVVGPITYSPARRSHFRIGPTLSCTFPWRLFKDISIYTLTREYTRKAHERVKLSPPSSTITAWENSSTRSPASGSVRPSAAPAAAPRPLPPEPTSAVVKAVLKHTPVGIAANSAAAAAAACNRRHTQQQLETLHTNDNPLLLPRASPSPRSCYPAARPAYQHRRVGRRCGRARAAKPSNKLTL
jgi:hypothetical protein